MKVIYSIFNNRDANISEVRFKLFLDKNDYILINQFGDHKFCLREKIDKSYFPEYSDSMLQNRQSGEYVEIRWDKGKLTPVIKDDELLGWESEEYWFKKIFAQITALEVLNGYVKKITTIMEECKSQIHSDDQSCYEKEITIDY